LAPGRQGGEDQEHARLQLRRRRPARHTSQPRGPGPLVSRRIPAEHPAEALAVLTDAVAALQRAGVTAWLTDGTLLGAVRERRFIAHDRDMDLGAMITQHSGAAMRELRAAGFHLRKTLGSKAAGLEHKLDRDGFRLD